MGCAEIISLIDVIITTVLTGVIIWQTYSLHKKQQELEERINNSQLEMQKRQLKVEVFDKRRKIRTVLYGISDFCDNYMKLLEPSKHEEISVSYYSMTFKILENKQIQNEINLDELVSDSKNLFDNELYELIASIISNYKTAINMSTLVCSGFLKDNDKNKIWIDSALEKVQYISDNIEFALESIDKKMDVSDY